METFPAHGVYGADGGVHVFEVVVAVDDGVDFEHDAVLAAHVRQPFEFLQVFSRAATDLDVRGFVEGIAGDGHDVDVFAVLG